MVGLVEVVGHRDSCIDSGQVCVLAGFSDLVKRGTASFLVVADIADYFVFVSVANGGVLVPTVQPCGFRDETLWRVRRDVLRILENVKLTRFAVELDNFQVLGDEVVGRDRQRKLHSSLLVDSLIRERKSGFFFGGRRRVLLTSG